MGCDRVVPVRLVVAPLTRAAREGRDMRSMAKAQQWSSDDESEGGFEAAGNLIPFCYAHLASLVVGLTINRAHLFNATPNAAGDKATARRDSDSDDSGSGSEDESDYDYDSDETGELESGR